MKARKTGFGLIALLPAALNISAPAAGATLTMPFCTGDGQVRTVQVPIDGPQLPGKDSGQCCAKGCHSGSQRKRNAK